MLTSTPVLCPFWTKYLASSESAPLVLPLSSDVVICDKRSFSGSDVPPACETLPVAIDATCIFRSAFNLLKSDFAPDVSPDANARNSVARSDVMPLSVASPVPTFAPAEIPEVPAVAAVAAVLPSVAVTSPASANREV